jgi:hypothetical protein
VLEPLGRDLHRAFEHVQLRADAEHLEQAAIAGTWRASLASRSPEA